VTILNTGAAGNVAVGTPIAVGSVVDYTGLGARLATVAPLNGQVLELVNGSYTPVQNAPLFFANLSGLISASSRAGVILDGYSSPGDGGQGQFFWTAGAVLAATLTFAASATVNTSVTLVNTVYPGDTIQPSLQPGVSYVVQSVTASTIVLTTAYTGTTGADTATVRLRWHSDGGTCVINVGGGWYRVFGDNALNVAWFGAKDDCYFPDLQDFTDNWPVLQNTMDGAKNDPTIFFPVNNTGAYAISKPLFISPAIQGATTLQGINGPTPPNTPGLVKTSTLCWYATSPSGSPGNHNAISYVGPLLAVTCIADPVYATSGSINMATLTPGGFGYPFINLQETGQGNINGLSAFTFECFINLPASPAIPTGGRCVIANSYGNKAIGPSTYNVLANALRLNIENPSGTYHLSGGLWTSGPTNTQKLFNGVAAFPTGVTTHIAVTYDGTNIRTFVNGVLDTTTAATGTIVQQWYEDFSIGLWHQYYPMVGGIYTPTSGLQIGSVRLTSTCQYTATFTPPTTELGLISGHKTLALINFGSAHRSVTQTSTPNNPGGHQGYIVSLSNFTFEYQTGLLDTGIPCWLPWHQGGGTGNVEYITVNRMNMAGQGTGVYLQSAQFITFNDCNLGGIRGVTCTDLAYFITFNHCQIGAQTITNDTSHNWAIGAGSEMIKLVDCHGGGGGFNVVAAPMAGAAATLAMERCYFDTGSLGNIYGQTAYSVTLKDCHLYQEFSTETQSLLLLCNVENFAATGGAIVAMGFQGPVITMVSSAVGSGAPNNTTWMHSYNEVAFGNYTQPYPYFSFGGTMWYYPVQVSGYSLDVLGGPDPGARVTSWLDTAGVGPLYFPQLQESLWTTNFPAAGTLTYPGNNFWPGIWIFTDTGSHLSTTTSVVLPFNIKGARKTFINKTSQTLSFTGPDGAAFTLASGKTCTAVCTDTWTGSGTVIGTWVKASPDT
jgi:hypothetical protein